VSPISCFAIIFCSPTQCVALQDISNPVTRSHMVFYPEDAKGSLGEVWHGTKMVREVPDHILTPMIRHNGSAYYVGELVKCTGGGWFLPKRWIRRDSVMHAVGYRVIDTTVKCFVLYGQPVLILECRQA
jgi:hypothetical protein